MPRIKLTEYRAKKLLLGDAYRGIPIIANEKPELPKLGRFAVKVDQGVKKRMKKGLVLLDQSPRAISGVVSKLRKNGLASSPTGGFSRFLAEPMLRHNEKDEQYVSFERVREGIRFMHAKAGGIEIESNPEAVETFILRNAADVKAAAQKTKLPENFLKHALEVFENNFFAFLEINPLVVINGKAEPLDAAVLVDSAGAFFVKDAWTADDIVEKTAGSRAEKNIEELAKTSPASFKLNVLNPNGSLFFLLSGGGGSIVIADEAELRGAGKEIGNYGEYSGGPTRGETYLYAKEVIGLLIKSKAKRKALIIAGGVANFTDVKQTFMGVIDALAENCEKLNKAGVKVFVRRGGPNEKEGLELMKNFLKKEKLLGSVYGSDAVITKAVDDAIKFIKVNRH
ncbi:MAG TPA: ATP citrate lyase citrate-binding domain-containing protein [Candidatus Paceibacterota bacterium]|nr:ATP citrate lyase citrate-binding domain-containing protein [Candidatus Paceibacterota bacterium]